MSMDYLIHKKWFIKSFFKTYFSKMIFIISRKKDFKFRVIAFYTAKDDLAHNSFVHEANTWFPEMAKKYNFIYDSTNNWNNLNSKFLSRYRWQNDLRKNPNIQILVSIDSDSSPLRTSPKQSEIWHSGYYPVVWTNKNYRMVYFNMGHNDIDYEHKIDDTSRTLSHTFDNKIQDQLIINALLWPGRK